MSLQDKWTARLGAVIKNCWDLGFTSFGGPNVHFAILHRRFVQKLKWIDEQVYQELFSINSVTPGPASTGLLYGIVLVRQGVIPSILTFFIWSLPGALGMLGVALGIRNVQSQLPDLVYALLSGLNAATVGLIALGGVQLSERAINNQMSRFIICTTGCVGILYTALWYYPVLMVVSGIAMVIYDSRVVQRNFTRIRNRVRRNRQEPQIELADIGSPPQEASSQEGEPESLRVPESVRVDRDADATPATGVNPPQASRAEQTKVTSGGTAHPISAEDVMIPYSIRVGIFLFCFFLVSFIVIMVVRGAVESLPSDFLFFANIYLAGTIIFGGGPVVIPLLSDYVVKAGFVSSRDFLIGLAIIQAFPGPNFNFAVFLGALAVPSDPALGALLGYLGIFFPGLIIENSVIPFWRKMRTRPRLNSALKGVACGAIGLVYTAVYRLWRIGLINADSQQGSPLENEPWFVLVCASSFIACKWYGAQPPLAIVAGGLLGMIWFGVVN